MNRRHSKSKDYWSYLLRDWFPPKSSAPPVAHRSASTTATSLRSRPVSAKHPVQAPIGHRINWRSELSTAERMVLEAGKTSFYWLFPIGGKIRRPHMTVWNRTSAISLLKHKAFPPYGQSRCAEFTRIAIEHGGLILPPAKSPYAKDYGDCLTHVGFVEVTPSPNTYLAGDVVVIQSRKGKIEGHMAMYDGEHWISDFVQPEGLYPHHAYRDENVPYKIYRYSGETK